MVTDAPPRKANRAQFLDSDRLKTLDLPKEGRLPSITMRIEESMKTDKKSRCAQNFWTHEAPTCKLYRFRLRAES